MMKRNEMKRRIFVILLAAILISCSLLNTTSAVNASAGTKGDSLTEKGVSIEQIKETLGITDLDVDDNVLEGLLSYPAKDDKTLRNLAEVVTVEKRYAELLQGRQLKAALKLISATEDVTEFIDISTNLLTILLALSGVTPTWLGITGDMLKYAVAIPSIIEAWETIRMHEMIYGSIANPGYVPLRESGWDDGEAWDIIKDWYENDFFNEKEEEIHTFAQDVWMIKSTDYLEKLSEATDTIANLIRERVATYKGYSTGDFTDGVAVIPTTVILTNNGEYPIFEVVLINEIPFWFDEFSVPFPEIEPGGKAVLGFPYGVERIDHLEFIVFNVKVRFPFQPSFINPIEKGLQYLRSTQNSDGSWQNSVGITSMAALAFLNAGYTEDDPTVNKAIQYILANQNADRSFGRETYDTASEYNLTNRSADRSFGEYGTYETSTAVWALIATHNPEYNDEIEDAANWLKDSQWDEDCLWGSVEKDDWRYGGFGYGWHSRPDLSNTQFALMALDAAPSISKDDLLWDKAQIFLARVQNRQKNVHIPNLDYTVEWNPSYNKYDDGGFVYHPGTSVSTT